MIETMSSLSPYIIAFLLAIIGIFLKAYLQEKGKLKATISENEKLIFQTERIKSEFNCELESLKKDHQLDITKRKYQYESKKDSYINFFKLIDSFTHDTNIKNTRKLGEVLGIFSNDYINAVTENDLEKQNESVINMSNQILQMTFEGSNELNRIRQETNTIRLIASKKVIEKLNELEIAFHDSIETANKTMRELPILMESKSDNQILLNQNELQLKANLTNLKTQELIELMRYELDEI
ncbi:hypothetical protein SAMN05421741_10860 [Paenimyroides ummariense]|uniref:Uncharacterized protein n=1 Tax=Paenimyroides ummariense TaxID=913024 RepID=A0A1I5AIJ1_9FLAO|nr:hypothetical protein [Paenimyroides ummariense]SFN62247.1 hypothetical protein SAMN05421741_10860 [Paenimyroides ummariense]